MSIWEKQKENNDHNHQDGFGWIRIIVGSAKTEIIVAVVNC